MDFLVSSLSIAAFAVVVFITPVCSHPTTLNRKQTLVSVSLGIINGLLWFVVYKSHETADIDQSGQSDLMIGALEDLMRHPECVFELLWRFAGRLTRRKSRREVLGDKDEKTTTPQERFVLPILRQVLERGLDIVRFRVQLKFGTGDAATTGIAVGLVYTLIGTVNAVFSERLRYPNDPPEIIVMPCFSEVCVDLDLDSIVILRPGNIVFQAVFGQD